MDAERCIRTRVRLEMRLYNARDDNHDENRVKTYARPRESARRAVFYDAYL